MTIGRVIDTVSMVDCRFYAREGEMVYCENGHEVGRITRDIENGEMTTGNEVEGFDLGYREAWPTCHCGGFFTIETNAEGKGGFLFKHGDEIVGRV
jgi:hypothetical protein